MTHNAPTTGGLAGRLDSTDPFESPRFRTVWRELVEGRPHAVDAMAAIALDPSAGPAQTQAAAAAALIAEHLAARGFVHRVRLSAALGSVAPAPLPVSTGELLRAGAAALLESYGEAGPEGATVRRTVSTLLEREHDLPGGDLPADAVLLACCALGEWCERNGLETAFERLAVAATLAEARTGATPWLAAHWRVTAAWQWCSLGREADARAALDRAAALTRAPALDEVSTVVELQRARLLDADAAPDGAAAVARRVRACADPRREPLWLADAADIECRVALRRHDYRAAVAHARQALAWLQAARAPASYRMTYALREVYALTGQGAVAETQSRIAAIEAIEPPPFLAARVQVVTGLLSLARRDQAQQWEDADSERLAKLLTRLRELEWPTVLQVLPQQMARLFARGLAAGTETPWLSGAIRRRRLDPPTDGEHAYPARWPWPVRLRLLGSFECRVDGEADLPPGGKAAAKPLALLRRIALHDVDGGVAAAALAQSLWPGEGREGRDKALETTLARLRKSLGCVDAVLLHEQRLRLNPLRVWCDWHALLRLLDRIERSPGEGFARGWAEVFTIWRGPLLADGDDAAWLAPWRERLRARVAAALLAGADTPGHVARCLRAISIEPALESWLLRDGALPV